MDDNISVKLDRFFQQHKRKSFKKREILLRGADEPIGLFFLAQGTVRQYVITSGGEELTLNIFKPPAMFPMNWVLNDTANSHFFEAMDAVTVWAAPKKEVLSFLKKEPDVLLDLVKRIYRGLDGYFLRMEHFMMGSSRTRLVAELLIYARRFGQLQKNVITVNIKLTESELAAQSGIARETVSREIQKLKQKGLINFRRSTLVINDLHRLEDEL